VFFGNSRTAISRSVASSTVLPTLRDSHFPDLRNFTQILPTYAYGNASPMALQTINTVQDGAEEITDDLNITVGQDSSVGIATRYGMDGQGIESQ
jgi:hypothetical protein